ncbi:MAG: DNA alkylation repair protein [Campylobacter sp.]|nr:DNA alkylation repair protein [Campylobacter sp.]
MIDEILTSLKNESEHKYAKFSANLIKTDLEILGVRVPKLHRFAKNLMNEEFIKADKKGVYELVLLEGLVISKLKVPFKEKLKFYENYIYKADNWALIDSVKFKNPDKFMLLNELKIWLKDECEFVRRAGLVNLIYHFVDEEYLRFIFEIPDDNNFYYDMMAHAWLISECMAKFPAQTLNFMEHSHLKKYTHNTTVKKCCESLRVTQKNKELLKTLKK